MDEGTARKSVKDTVEGERQADFGLYEWGSLSIAALVFGSAFLWIALALRSFEPGPLAFGRVSLGALALAVIPRARVAVARIDRMRLTAASFFGMGAPALLFSFAEQRVPSAIAGMLIASAPIMTATLVAVVTRTLPTRARVMGLLIGFVGIALLTGPNLTASGTETAGVVMALTGVLFYAIAAMLYAPLQRTYGALPVTMWLLIVSTVMLAPLAIAGFGETTFELGPTGALLVLGVIGTGLAWALWVTLIGRVGAVRSSLVGYLIPIVALVLGVLVLDEHVEAIQIVGVAVVLSGGYLLSRGSARTASR